MAARSTWANGREGIPTRAPPRSRFCSRASATVWRNRRKPSEMADLDEIEEGKNYHLDKPHQGNLFYLKGSNSLDWGMKNRLARIFNPASGKTVMLAVDHGYFQGPTTGLERIDVTIVPLVPYADALMITRGALRTSIPAETPKPVVLRSTGGQSILKELSNELIAVDIEDAVRLNASALAVQVYIGGQHE